ncbi:hypothetical protein CDAR_586391 [Caerostris darwini]|uniref:Uncharacterized protein n=1 Tax=Caerostris darwini TaxID=1538125 RepID=A0AAV4QB35_9ARAC|nr:hypothetical protein CDAR_586391 [Caerostris darwini]
MHLHILTSLGKKKLQKKQRSVQVILKPLSVCSLTRRHQEISCTDGISPLFHTAPQQNNNKNLAFLFQERKREEASYLSSCQGKFSAHNILKIACVTPKRLVTKSIRPQISAFFHG